MWQWISVQSFHFVRNSTTGSQLFLLPISITAHFLTSYQLLPLFKYAPHSQPHSSWCGNGSTPISATAFSTSFRARTYTPPSHANTREFIPMCMYVVRSLRLYTWELLKKVKETKSKQVVREVRTAIKNWILNLASELLTNKPLDTIRHTNIRDFRNPFLLCSIEQWNLLKWSKNWSCISWRHNSMHCEQIENSFSNWLKIKE